MKKRSLRIWAVSVLICFSFNALTLPKQGFAAAFSNSSDVVGIQMPFQLEIPAEFGKIETLQSGAGAAVIHIQEAHGSYEGQKKIYRILKHLKKNYGVKLLFLEGTAFKLHQELLELYPNDSARTLKDLDRLAKKSLVTGPEFLMAQDAEWKAYGIEEIETYKANSRAFVEVLRQKEKTEKFTEEMNAKMKSLAGPYLNPDLRVFLERAEDYESRRLSLDDWISFLKEQAKKNLGTDLHSPLQQKDWPMLLRIFTLKNIEAEFDKAAFEKERPAFLQAIQRFLPRSQAGEETLAGEISRILVSPLSQNQLPHPETGLLFESMVSKLPRDFNYARFPQVNRFIGHLILQSELEGSALMSELEQLQDAAASGLAKTEQEKTILYLFKQRLLLKKLFSLELTPEDYEKVLQEEARLDPAALAENFLKLSQEKYLRAAGFQHMEEITALFREALEFYRLAKERDGKMLSVLETRLRESPESKAVVITGGFHSHPFGDYFKRRGYSYALITPQMTVTSGQETYVKLFLENFLDSEKPKSALKAIPYAASTDAEMRQLGVNPDAVEYAIQSVLGVRRGITPGEIPGSDKNRFTKTPLNLAPSRFEARGVITSRAELELEMGEDFGIRRSGDIIFWMEEKPASGKTPVRLTREEIGKAKQVLSVMKESVQGIQVSDSDRLSNAFGVFKPAHVSRVLRTLKLLNDRPRKTLFDAGHGTGRVLFLAQALFGFTGFGAEGLPLLYRKSQLALLFLQERGLLSQGSVNLTWGNFLRQSWKNKDSVFYYSFGSHSTAQLEEKLIQELKLNGQFILFGDQEKGFNWTGYEDFSGLLDSGDFQLERYPELGVWIFARIRARSEVRDDSTRRPTRPSLSPTRAEARPEGTILLDGRRTPLPQTLHRASSNAGIRASDLLDSLRDSGILKTEDSVTLFVNGNLAEPDTQIRLFQDALDVRTSWHEKNEEAVNTLTQDLRPAARILTEDEGMRKMRFTTETSEDGLSFVLKIQNPKDSSHTVTFKIEERSTLVYGVWKEDHYFTITDSKAAGTPPDVWASKNLPERFLREVKDLFEKEKRKQYWRDWIQMLSEAREENAEIPKPDVDFIRTHRPEPRAEEKLVHVSVHSSEYPSAEEGVKTLISGLQEKGNLHPESIIVTDLRRFAIAPEVTRGLEKLGSQKRIRLVMEGAYLNDCCQTASEAILAYARRHPEKEIEIHYPVDLISHPHDYKGQSDIDEKVADLKLKLGFSADGIPYQIYVNGRVTGNDVLSRPAIPEEQVRLRFYLWSAFNEMLSSSVISESPGLTKPRAETREDLTPEEKALIRQSYQDGGGPWRTGTLPEEKKRVWLFGEQETISPFLAAYLPGTGVAPLSPDLYRDKRVLVMPGYGNLPFLIRMLGAREVIGMDSDPATLAWQKLKMKMGGGEIQEAVLNASESSRQMVRNHYISQWLTRLDSPPQEGLTGLSFKIQDILQPIPQDGGAFDLIVVPYLFGFVHGLETEAQWNAAFENMKNALSPGGSIVLIPGQMETAALQNNADKVLSENYQRWLESLSGRGWTMTHSPVYPFYHVTGSQPVQAGYTVLRHESRTVKLLQDLQSILKEINIPELEIFLFGSSAEDKTHDASDLDLITIIKKGTLQKRATEIGWQLDLTQKRIAEKLQGKGYPRIEWHDIAPASIENYNSLWKKGEFFTRNRYVWHIGAEFIQGYKRTGDEIVSVTPNQYANTSRIEKESEALRQDIKKLQDDLRAALEAAEPRAKASAAPIAGEDAFGLLEGTPLDVSAQAPAVNLFETGSFLTRQKAVAFYVEQFAALAGKDPRVQEFRASLSVIESQISRLEQYMGRAEGRGNEEEDQDDEDKEDRVKPAKALLEYEADFGFLPETNGTVQFVRKKLARLFPELTPEELPDIKILAKTGMGVNAMAFSNWTIVLTPEMIHFLKFEEELDFVILHELNHIMQNHFEMDEASRRTQKLMEVFGSMRYGEYDADMRAFYQMADPKRGSNPLGAIYALERLRDERPAGWDPAHGSVADRILNMKMALRFLDLTSAGNYLTPLKSQRTLSVRGLTEGKFSSHFFEKVPSPGAMEWSSWKGRAQKILHNADFNLLNFLLPAFYKKIQEAESQDSIMARAGREEQFMLYSGLLSAALQRWNQLFDIQYAALSENEKTLRRVFYLEIYAGIPVVSAPLSKTLGAMKLYPLKMTDLNNLRRSFSQQFETREAVQTLLDSPLESGRYFPEGRFLNFTVNFLKTSLQDYALFDEKDGRLAVREFLKFSQEMLLNARRAEKQFSIYESEDELNKKLTQAWTDVVSFGAFMLAQFGQLTPDYASDAEAVEKEIAHGEAMKVNPEYFKVLAPGLKVQAPRIYPQWETYVEQYWVEPIHRQLSASLRRLTEIYEAMKKLEQPILVSEGEVAQTRFVMDENNPEHLKLLQEAAAILQSLPSRIPIKILRDHAPMMSKMLDERITNLGDVQGDILKQDFLKNGGIHQDLFIKMFLEKNLFVSDDYSFQGAITRIHWAQSFFLKDITAYELEVEFFWHTSLSWLEKNELATAVNDFSRVEAFYGVKGKNIDAQWRIEDVSDHLDFALEWVDEQLLHAATEEEFFRGLNLYVQRWTVPMSSSATELKRKQSILKEGLKWMRWEEISKSPKEWDEITLERLLQLSFFIGDISIRQPFQEFLLLRYLEKADFERAVALSFDRYKQQGPLGGLLFYEKMIEEKAQTPEQLETMRRKMQEILRPDQKSGLGIAVMVDGFMEILFEGDGRKDFFKAALESQQDDKLLRDKLTAAWTSLYGNRVSQDIQGVRNRLQDGADPADDSMMKGEIEFLESPVYRAPQMADSLYRLGHLQRHGVLRKLFLGEHGILESEVGRRDLLDDFFDAYLLSDKKSQAEDILKKVLSSMLMVAPQDELFLMLEALLSPRILNPPLKRSSWKDRINDVKASLWLELQEDLNPRRSKFAEALNKRLSYLFAGDEQEAGNSIEDSIYGVIPQEFFPKSQGKFEAMDLILDLARQLGAPGVRFLQLLGQVIDIPEEYRAKFSEVYDSMKGQSKIAAWETIKREAPEYAKQIKRMIRRIGGGSLFTVYEVELIDGTREAVRVLNPNAAYHAKFFVQLIQDSLKVLSKKSPEYKKAIPLVDLIEEWIEEELEDASYEADEARFKKAWQGWAPKGFKRKVRIPETKPTESPKVRRESYIEGFHEHQQIDSGDNLTSLKNFSPEAQKELVSLAVQHYAAQITGSVFQGDTLVHSDVSGGNLRVDAKGDLVILDRGMYLKFDMNDRLFVKSLLAAKNTKDRAKRFTDWVWALEDNKKAVQKADRAVVEKDILDRLEAGKSAGEEAVLEAFKAVQSRGLQIPLKFNLLFKNLNALRQLAVEAGFDAANPLKAALAYAPLRAEARIRKDVDKEKKGMAESSSLGISRRNLLATGVFGFAAIAAYSLWRSGEKEKFPPRAKDPAKDFIYFFYTPHNREEDFTRVAPFIEEALRDAGQGGSREGVIWRENTMPSRLYGKSVFEPLARSLPERMDEDFIKWNAGQFGLSKPQAFEGLAHLAKAWVKIPEADAEARIRLYEDPSYREAFEALGVIIDRQLKKQMKEGEAAGILDEHSYGRAVSLFSRKKKMPLFSETQSAEGIRQYLLRTEMVNLADELFLKGDYENAMRWARKSHVAHEAWMSARARNSENDIRRIKKQNPEAVIIAMKGRAHELEHQSLWDAGYRVLAYRQQGEIAFHPYTEYRLRTSKQPLADEEAEILTAHALLHQQIQPWISAVLKGDGETANALSKLILNGRDFYSPEKTALPRIQPNDVKEISAILMKEDFSKTGRWPMEAIINWLKANGHWHSSYEDWMQGKIKDFEFLKPSYERIPQPSEVRSEMRAMRKTDGPLLDRREFISMAALLGISLPAFFMTAGVMRDLITIRNAESDLRGEFGNMHQFFLRSPHPAEPLPSYLGPHLLTHAYVLDLVQRAWTGERIDWKAPLQSGENTFHYAQVSLGDRIQDWTPRAYWASVLQYGLGKVGLGVLAGALLDPRRDVRPVFPYEKLHNRSLYLRFIKYLAISSYGLPLKNDPLVQKFQTPEALMRFLANPERGLLTEDFIDELYGTLFKRVVLYRKWYHYTQGAESEFSKNDFESVKRGWAMEAAGNVILKPDADSLVLIDQILKEIDLGKLDPETAEGRLTIRYLIRHFLERYGITEENPDRLEPFTESSLNLEKMGKSLTELMASLESGRMESLQPGAVRELLNSVVFPDAAYHRGESSMPVDSANEEIHTGYQYPIQEKFDQWGVDLYDESNEEKAAFLRAVLLEHRDELLEKLKPFLDEIKKRIDEYQAIETPLKAQALEILRKISNQTPRFEARPDDIQRKKTFKLDGRQTQFPETLQKASQETGINAGDLIKILKESRFLSPDDRVALYVNGVIASEETQTRLFQDEIEVKTPRHIQNEVVVNAVSADLRDAVTILTEDNDLRAMRFKSEISEDGFRFRLIIQNPQDKAGTVVFRLEKQNQIQNGTAKIIYYFGIEDGKNIRAGSFRHGQNDDDFKNYIRDWLGREKQLPYWNEWLNIYGSEMRTEETADPSKLKYDFDAWLKRVSQDPVLNQETIKAHTAELKTKMRNLGGIIARRIVSGFTGASPDEDARREYDFIGLIETAAIYILDSELENPQDLVRLRSILKSLDALIDVYNQRYPKSPKLSVPLAMILPLSIFFPESEEEAFIQLRSRLHRLPDQYGVRAAAFDLMLTGMHLRADTQMTDYADIERILPNFTFALEQLESGNVPAASRQYLEFSVLKFLLTLQPFLVDLELWDLADSANPFYYFSTKSSSPEKEKEAFWSLKEMASIRELVKTHAPLVRDLLAEFQARPVEFQRQFLALQFNFFTPYYQVLRNKGLHASLEERFSAFIAGDKSALADLPSLLHSEKINADSPVMLSELFDSGYAGYIEKIDRQLKFLAQHPDALFTSRAENRMISNYMIQEAFGEDHVGPALSGGRNDDFLYDESGKKIAVRMPWTKFVFRALDAEGKEVPDHIIKITHYAANNDQLFQEALNLFHLQKPSLHSGFPIFVRAGMMKNGGMWMEQESIPNARSLEREIFGRVSRLFEVLIQAGELMQLMHERGFVHADVKPDQFLINDSGRLQLIDYGNARRMQSSGEPDFEGYTPGYAPINESGEPITKDLAPDTDVYSFILMVARLLDDQVLSGRKDLSSILESIRDEYLYLIFKDFKFERVQEMWGLGSPLDRFTPLSRKKWPQSMAPILEKLKSDLEIIRRAETRDAMASDHAGPSMKVIGWDREMDGNHLATNENVINLIKALEREPKKGAYLGIGSFHNLDLALDQDAEAIVLVDYDEILMRFLNQLLTLIAGTEFKDIHQALAESGLDKTVKNKRVETPLLWLHEEARYLQLQNLIRKGNVLLVGGDITSPETSAAIQDWLTEKKAALRRINLSNAPTFISSRKNLPQSMAQTLNTIAPSDALVIEAVDIGPGSVHEGQRIIASGNLTAQRFNHRVGPLSAFYSDSRAEAREFFSGIVRAFMRELPEVIQDQDLKFELYSELTGIEQRSAYRFIKRRLGYPIEESYGFPRTLDVMTAFYKGKLVGTYFFQIDGSQANGKGIHVIESFRRKGIGRRLRENLFRALFQQRGVHRFYFAADKTPEAQGFHREIAYAAGVHAFEEPRWELPGEPVMISHAFVDLREFFSGDAPAAAPEPRAENRGMQKRLNELIPQEVRKGLAAAFFRATQKHLRAASEEAHFLLKLVQEFEASRRLALEEGLATNPIFKRTSRQLLQNTIMNPEAFAFLLTEDGRRWILQFHGFPYMFRLALFSLARDPGGVKKMLQPEGYALRPFGELKTGLARELKKVEGLLKRVPADTEELLKIKTEVLRDKKIETVNRFLALEFIKRFVFYQKAGQMPSVESLLENEIPETIFTENRVMAQSLQDLSLLVLQEVYAINMEAQTKLYGTPSSKAAIVLGGSHSRTEWTTFDFDAVFVYEKDGMTSGGIAGAISNQEFYNQVARLTGDSLHSMGRRWDGDYQSTLFAGYAEEHRIDPAQPWSISLQNIRSALQKDSDNRQHRAVRFDLLTFGAGDSKIYQKFIEIAESELQDERSLKLAMVDLYRAVMEPSARPGQRVDIKEDPGGLRTIHYLLWFARLMKRLRHEPVAPSGDTVSLLKDAFPAVTAHKLEAYFLYIMNLRFELDLFYAKNKKEFPMAKETLDRLIHNHRNPLNAAADFETVSQEDAEKFFANLQRVFDAVISLSKMVMRAQFKGAPVSERQFRDILEDIKRSEEAPPPPPATGSRNWQRDIDTVSGYLQVTRKITAALADRVAENLANHKLSEFEHLLKLATGRHEARPDEQGVLKAEIIRQKLEELRITDLYVGEDAQGFAISPATEDFNPGHIQEELGRVKSALQAYDSRHGGRYHFVEIHDTHTSDPNVQLLINFPRDRSESRDAVLPDHYKKALGHQEGYPDESRVDFGLILGSQIGFPVTRLDRPVRFLDMGTGNGDFVGVFKRYLEQLGYQTEGYGLDTKRPSPELKGDPSYIWADIESLEEEAPQLEPGSFDLITMNAPRLIENAVRLEKLFLVPGKFEKWLFAAKRLLSERGVIAIRLYEYVFDDDENDDLSAEWMLAESMLLKRLLDADPDLEYQEFTQASTPDLPRGKTPVGPLILVTRKPKVEMAVPAVVQERAEKRDLRSEQVTAKAGSLDLSAVKVMAQYFTGFLVLIQIKELHGAEVFESLVRELARENGFEEKASSFDLLPPEVQNFLNSKNGNLLRGLFAGDRPELEEERVIHLRDVNRILQQGISTLGVEILFALLNPKAEYVLIAQDSEMAEQILKLAREYAREKLHMTLGNNFKVITASNGNALAAARTQIQKEIPTTIIADSEENAALREGLEELPVFAGARIVRLVDDAHLSGAQELLLGAELLKATNEQLFRMVQKASQHVDGAFSGLMIQIQAFSKFLQAA